VPGRYCCSKPDENPPWRLAGWLLSIAAQMLVRIVKWPATVHTMVNEKLGQSVPEKVCEAAVAEFIRTRGVTRCPTACVLPTQGSVAAADREALEEYAVRRDSLRRARVAARAQQYWNVELLPPVEK
jgi:hypothetical protein